MGGHAGGQIREGARGERGKVRTREDMRRRSNEQANNAREQPSTRITANGAYYHACGIE